MIVYDPLRPPHIITLEHRGILTAVARCRCRSFHWGLLTDVESWMVRHRRKHFPGFRG